MNDDNSIYRKMKRSRLKLLSIKITEDDLKLIKKLSLKFAEGNLSAWFRIAALEYIPKKKLKLKIYR